MTTPRVATRWETTMERTEDGIEYEWLFLPVTDASEFEITPAQATGLQFRDCYHRVPGEHNPIGEYDTKIDAMDAAELYARRPGWA